MNRRDVIRLAVIAVVLAAAVLLATRIDTARGSREKELVEQAVRDAALTCYAVEGAYPADLSYLRTHYRLSFDEERYVVFYEAWGDDVMPDIHVENKGASGV